jgi:hypothetical protein
MYILSNLNIKLSCQGFGSFYVPTWLLTVCGISLGLTCNATIRRVHYRQPCIDAQIFKNFRVLLYALIHEKTAIGYDMSKDVFQL